MYAVGTDYAIGAQAGDNYNGTASGNTYTFDLESQTAGDYWCQLFISGTGQGVYFPVRNDVAYPWTPWEVIVNTLVDAVVVGNVTQPTAAKERLTDPIIIGDDYLASVGRNFEWQVNAISGKTAAELSCRWGGKKDGVGWLVDGTVTTITGGISLKFDLPKTATASLTPGFYSWSVEVYTTSGGIEVTRVVGKQPVQLVEKQT
tara:strand:- start:954 stop:1562 length:609 start_codon:yes stop_codon:yes gene_type:complete